MDLPEKEVKPTTETPRRLTAVERREWPKRFQVWRTPDAMEALWDELHEITGVSMMYQAGVEFTRNAWIAAHFAKARRKQEVRLSSGTRPDFEMKLDGTHELFEATEAGNLEGRGDHYRDFDERRAAAVAAGIEDYVEVEHDPVEDWGVEQASAMLERAARRKADGNYDPTWSLVVLLTLGEYGMFRRKVEAVLKPGTAPAKGRFREVWVLWNGRAYRTW